MGATVSTVVHRWRTSTAIAILALLVMAASGAAWWAITGEMTRELAAWQMLQRAKGIAVEFDRPSRTGWPFRAELLVPDISVSVSVMDNPASISWRTRQLRIVFAPWRPNSVSLQFDEHQHIQLGSVRLVDVAAKALIIRYPMFASKLPVSVDACGVTIQLPGQLAKLTSIAASIRPNEMTLSARDVDLSSDKPAFGLSLNTLSFHTRWPAFPLDVTNPGIAIDTWRTNRLRLELDDVDLRWGPTDVHGTASIGIANDGQAEGEALGHITGFSDAVSSLRRAGIITDGNARVATTLLGLLAAPSSAGVPQVDLPITLRDRTVSVGAIPLIRLPLLAFP